MTYYSTRKALEIHVFILSRISVLCGDGVCPLRPLSGHRTAVRGVNKSLFLTLSPINRDLGSVT